MSFCFSLLSPGFSLILLFFLPASVKGGASLFFSLSDEAGCALTLPDPPSFFQTSTLMLLPPAVSSWVWRSAAAVL